MAEGDPHPSTATHPKAHEIWEINDCSLRAFIFGHISLSDYNAVESLTTSHLIFKELYLCHEKLGPYVQLLLIKQVLDYHYDPDAPLHCSTDEILALHTKITKMGPINFDQLKIIFLINAFRDRFKTVQSSILTAMDSPSFNANTILCCFDQEDSISHACVAQGGQNSMALLALRRDKPPCICSNCKKEGHLIKFCILPGGGLAGKSIKEACNAQRAASRRHGNQSSQHSQASTTASANIATASITSADSSESMTINSRTWVLVPEVPDTSCDIQPTINLVEVTNKDVAHAMAKDNLFEFEAY